MIPLTGKQTDFLRSVMILQDSNMPAPVKETAVSSAILADVQSYAQCRQEGWIDRLNRITVGGREALNATG